jgi:hypothetical protein
MPYGQINQWEFSYDAHYVTRWITEALWNAVVVLNDFLTAWRSVKSAFRELTVWQVKPQNVDRKSKNLHILHTNSQKRMVMGGFTI